jgi:quercetin dioxygenase-like cupin family protein
MERDETTTSAARQTVRPVDLRDYADFDPERPKRIRVLATDVLTIDLWCLEPRQETPSLLYRDVDVCYTVLGGTAWFITDEGELGLGPLGAMLVPAGITHTIGNRTVDPVVVLASGSPPDVPATDVTSDAPVVTDASAVHRPREPGALVRTVKRLLGGSPPS